MGVTHAFVSTVDDDPNTTLVRPSNWNAGHVIGSLDKGVVGIVVDGGGGSIAAGIKGSVQASCSGTITSWTLLADQAGSVVVDVWKDVIGNYPPTVTDTITGSAKPTLSSAVSASSSTLTGWTTSITSGDVFRFNVDSISDIKMFTLELHYTKT